MRAELGKYFLNNKNFLEKLPEKISAIMQAGIVRFRVKKGRVLFQENSFPKGIYILKKGKVKIYSVNRDGREQIMYIYCPGDIFGYRPLLYEGTHPVSAAALEESTCDLIPREIFIELVEKSPELMRVMLRLVSSEFPVWVNKINVFAQQSVKSRVALGLLIVEKKYKVKGQPTEINLSRDDFAAYVGTVKETLVRMLKEFKEKGILETQGRKIRILKPGALEKIAEIG
ncbi:MAG TPA: Crp/Fnr family transcriptional regulator [Bacteroidia bacterium]|nr:Crp/Fnr family transcriptional regulator [Bacteroidia bacterium]